MIEEAVGRHSVSCKFKCISDGFIWPFSGVYGPHKFRETFTGI